LDRLRPAAQDEHIAAVLNLGGHAAVVDELHRLAEESPLRERRWAMLMRALLLSGRRAEALEAFHRARVVLRAELGLDPGPELRQLQREVLTDVALAHPAQWRIRSHRRVIRKSAAEHSLRPEYFDVG
jgi:DNA-binding SARP family transcriptional activator